MTLPVLENRVYLDWFAAHTQDSLRRYLVSSSGSSSDLLEFLNPWGAPYHSPLNPVFLAECEHLKQLDFAPTWLARDGLIPLLWFFMRYPEPRGFKGRIYLPADLYALAPDAWRPRIATYRFGELPAPRRPRGLIENRANVTRLVLLGINSPAYCGQERLRDLLADARKRFNTRFGANPKEVVVCLVQKSEPLGTVDQASRHANETMLAICREFGTRITVMDLKNFELGLSFKGTAILELNERLLCTDTSLVHAAVGRGAVLLSDPLSGDGAAYVRTTLTHGFELQNRPARPTPAQRQALQIRIDEAMTSTANRNFPWQLWTERDVKQELLTVSPVTGRYRTFETGGRRLNIMPLDQCSLDVIYVGTDQVVIHGWCVDPVHGRAPVDIRVFRNSKRLLGNVTHTSRADVQRRFDRKFDENFRPGFEFHLPRSAMKEIRAGEVFSVFALFSHNLAANAGHFTIDPQTNDIRRLPVRNPSMGSYMPVRLARQRADLYPEGLGKRPVSYTITEPGGHYQALLDVCRNDDGDLFLSGWAADLNRSEPAEAVLVFGGKNQSLVFPVSNRRPDIAKKMDHLEISGFSLRAPWVRPRVFVLFETGVAVELKIPATSGSA